jgi:SAM-dependent methyltransferase
MEVGFGALAASTIHKTAYRWYCIARRLRRETLERLQNWQPSLYAHVIGLLQHATGRVWKEDYFDRWTGRRDELTPPRRLLIDGTRTYAEYREYGAHFARYLIEHDLQPHHRVLEVGSGNGKNARALTDCLSPPGSYEGFDIVPEAVAWCQGNITRRFPHFRFRHEDLHSRTYHPLGRLRACAHLFPYASGSFDLVFLTSVFTHMFPAEIAHYLGEITRVLKPSGRCFASFYLLNEVSRPAAMSGQSAPAFRFAHGSPSCRIADPRWPEDAVAHDEELIRGFFDRHGFDVSSVTYGSWWRGCWNVQDMVWASKR